MTEPNWQDPGWQEAMHQQWQREEDEAFARTPLGRLATGIGTVYWVIVIAIVAVVLAGLASRL